MYGFKTLKIKEIVFSFYRLRCGKVLLFSLISRCTLLNISPWYVFEHLETRLITNSPNTCFQKLQHWPAKCSRSRRRKKNPPTRMASLACSAQSISDMTLWTPVETKVIQTQGRIQVVQVIWVMTPFPRNVYQIKMIEKIETFFLFYTL